MANPESVDLLEIGRKAASTVPGLAGNEAGRSQMAKAIIRDMESIVRHTPVVADLSEDLLHLLNARWKRTAVERKRRESRLRWLELAIRECVSRGLIEPIAVPQMEPINSWHGDPDKTRQAVPMPEDAPESIDPAKRSQMKLLDLLEEHYIPERLIGKSPETARLHRISIRNYSKWLGRSARLGDLNRDTMLGFLRYLTHETKLAPATVAKDRTQLLALWRFAARRGWLATFPEVPTIHVPERIPDAWTREELEALFAACSRQEGYIGKVPADLFWTGLVCVIFDTAERVGALVKLKWDNITADGWLTTLAEDRKGKTRDKRFKLRPATLGILERIRAFGEANVFPWPYNRNYIFNRFGKILKEAGLPANRRTKFHKLRRTVASEFEAAGGNATELLDHSTRRTTLRYLDPRVRREQMPADVLPGIGEAVERAVENGDESELLEEIKRLIAAKREQRSSTEDAA